MASTGGRAEPAVVLPSGLLTRRRGRAAAVVVSERGDRGERLREGIDPLRTVHHRGADRVGGAAGIDQNVVQRPARQGRVVRRERQPLTRAVGVELGDVENAVVQGIDPSPARHSPRQVRHIAVDVFVPLVVAHVDDDLAVLRLLDPRPFMLETAERGALDGRRFRIERIDLHHPAEPVGFVGLGIGVEPRVSGVPPKARS